MTAVAVRLNAISLTWPPVNHPTVIGYLIERRDEPQRPVYHARLASSQERPRGGAVSRHQCGTPRRFTDTAYTRSRSSGTARRRRWLAAIARHRFRGSRCTRNRFSPSAESADPDGNELAIAGPRHGARTHWRHRHPTGLAAAGGSVPSVAGWARLSMHSRPVGSTVTVTDTTCTDGRARQLSGNVPRSEPRRDHGHRHLDGDGTRQHDTIELLGRSERRDVARQPAGHRPDAVDRGAERNHAVLQSAARYVRHHAGRSRRQLHARRHRDTDRRRGGARKQERCTTLSRCTSGGGGPDPDPGYQYRATWSSLGGNQYALDLRIDMRTFNRPEHRTMLRRLG